MINHIFITWILHKRVFLLDVNRGRFRAPLSRYNSLFIFLLNTADFPTALSPKILAYIRALLCKTFTKVDQFVILGERLSNYLLIFRLVKVLWWCRKLQERSKDRCEMFRMVLFLWFVDQQTFKSTVKKKNNRQLAIGRHLSREFLKRFFWT